MANEIILSTDMVEPAARTDLCREMSRHFFEPRALSEGAEPLELSLRSRLVGRMAVVASRHGPQRYRRERRHIAAGMDQYFIRLLLNGRHEGACGERPTGITAGDICVFDLSRPFCGEVDRGAMLSLMLPRSAVEKAAPGRDLHGLVLERGAPVTVFLTDFMASFAKLSETLDESETLAIEDAAIGLLGACLSRQAPPRDPALGLVLRHRLLDFIESHLAAPDLGPALLMQRFQVSRAHLYRMFVAEGGVAALIRDKRLDAAFHALASVNGGHWSIAKIAHSFGFSSATQFHRAFRARFGVTPSEARHETRPGTAGLQAAIVGWHEHCVQRPRMAARD